MRIALILSALLFLANTGFAQKSGPASKSRTRPNTPRVDKTVADGQAKWPAFWARFGKSAKERDFANLKVMMVSDYLDCDITDVSGSLDLKQQCLQDWQGLGENSAGVTWDDLLGMVSSGNVCKITKEDSSLGWSLQRFVVGNGYRCDADGPIGARLVFVKGNWFLQAFKQWEQE